MKEGSSGIGCGGVLLIVFVVLKLTGNINWSWFWVLSPITIPICIILFIAFMALCLKEKK